MKRKTPTAAREPLPLAGLRFAVYARKSNEDDRNPDHTSIARQVEQATRWVEGRGGAVLADHAYTDDAVSGAEFRDRRGLLRFLDCLKNGRPFNALVMSEQSRLGREQLETGYLLKQIRDADVRVFYYLTGDEAKLDSALDKIMSSLTSFAGEMEREKARQRARDAAERKARQGHVTGGEPFGFENIHIQNGKEVPRGQLHDYVKRRIREDEADTVRRIYRMYAAGNGLVVISKALNGVPTHAALRREFFGGEQPAPPRHGKGSWAPMGVREILYRRLYRGEILWGQTSHVDRNGRAGVRVKRDQGEWLTVPAPELKIVPDDLWEQVQRRLAASTECYLRDTRGKLWGKPDLRREGGYLLSGLAKCGACGYNLTVVGGTKVRRYYSCAHHHRKGTCPNSLTVQTTLADDAFLAALERECLSPDRFRRAVEHAMDRVREELAKDPDRGPALEKERAGLARKIKWMVAAIGDGKGPASLVQEIAKAEGRIKEIEAESARLAAAPALAAVDLGRIEEAVAEQLGRFTDLLKGNVPRARQLLKKLLHDRVEFTPVDAAGGKTYAFTGQLSYGAALRETLYMRRAPLGARKCFRYLHCLSVIPVRQRPFILFSRSAPATPGKCAHGNPATSTRL